MSDTINFTREKYLDLRRAYEKAVAENKEHFEFDGKPMLTRYTYYLLDYLGAIPGIGKK